MNQKSIRSKIFLEGIGVHSGQLSSITLSPLGPDSGVILKNLKYNNNSNIKLGTVVPEQAMHATVLKSSNNQLSISTVEHLLAAIFALDIDNILIEIDGTEVPIIDGSALPFAQAILKAGVTAQDSKKVFITPKKELLFEHESKLIKIIPTLDTNNPKLTFDYSIDFNHPLVKKNKILFTLTPETFIKDIAPARTFGFLHQLPLMRKHGLAKGTNLGNTVVIGEEEFLNNCRFDDELIRHKLLDLIGDISLLGNKIAGHIVAHRTGHSFNRRITEHFINNRDQWVLFKK